MIVGKWQIGLHIQSDSIVAVALVRKQGGWRQQRWWMLPLAPHQDGEQRRQALIEALTPWRAAAALFFHPARVPGAAHATAGTSPACDHAVRTGMRSLAWGRGRPAALSAARRAGV